MRNLDLSEIEVSDQRAWRVICSPGDMTRYDLDVSWSHGACDYIVRWGAVQLVASWGGCGTALTHLHGGRGKVGDASMVYNLETIQRILEDAVSKGLLR